MDVTQIIMLVAVMIALAVLLLGTSKRLRRVSGRRAKPAPEQYRNLRDQEVNTRGIDQAMVELDQLSRQVHGRIDTKLAKLEAVIRIAEDRIKTLSKLAQSSHGSLQEDQVQKDFPPVSRPRIDIALTEEIPGASPPPDPVVTGIRATIYRLADEGMSPLDIAQEVGQPTGEIELILALRRTVQEGSTEHS